MTALRPLEAQVPPWTVILTNAGNPGAIAGGSEASSESSGTETLSVERQSGRPFLSKHRSRPEPQSRQMLGAVQDNCRR